MQVLENDYPTQATASRTPAFDGVSPEEARAELDRVMRSKDFPATLRNRRFLSFVAEHALEANGSGNVRVSAHEVATRVFGRPDSFNTLLDPIVRIEAGKLRRDLETYYLKSGRGNSVRISVPRGGYDPVFTRQELQPESSPAARATTTGNLASDVTAELARLLKSGDFPATERNRSFLAYVVEKELAGQPEEITASLIAIRVFGRKENFNPNKDPIVRIEAAKLRRDLETYYLKSGRTNPLQISLPKGGYRPRFTYHQG
jgi:hypothetical protein